MTVKECYEQMGADYEGVLGRLRSEVLIKKFGNYSVGNIPRGVLA